MINVAIIHGWAEGRWESKRFRKMLAKEDFQLLSSAESADVVVAHSLGCYLVPKDTKARLIVLIGLPYWPGRLSVESAGRKLANEAKHHRRDQSLFWWLNKVAHNAWYILSKPWLSYYAITRKSPEFLPSGDGHKVLLIRGKDDTFCHPDVMKLLPEAKNYKFVELDHAHDDCWLNPSPYVDLIAKEL